MKILEIIGYKIQSRSGRNVGEIGCIGKSCEADRDK